MGILQFNYRSEAVGGYTNVTVVYPTDAFTYTADAPSARRSAFPAPPKPLYRPGMKFQTVYLLHGGGDDDSLVYRYTNAERYAQRNRVMLVTPSIVNSFGVDTNYGVAYSTFLTEELPVVVQSLFASSPAREDNFIVGYAMGGNAALGNALMHPERYAVCVDISGGIGLTLDTEKFARELAGDHFRKGFPLVGATFGESADLPGSRHDLYAIAKAQLARGAQLPLFHLMAGEEEGFIRERVEGDARILKELGIEATLTIAKGRRHDFTYWDEAFAYVFDELLPLKRDAVYED